MSQLEQKITERYEIVELLHRGQNSEIFHCKETTTKRDISVKVLTPTGQSNRIKRFQHAAKCLAHLRHNGFPTVYDFGMTEQLRPFIVMELYRGQDLESIVRTEGPLPINRFRTIFSSLCTAMAFCHETGILHKDLKPSHFLITKNATGQEHPVIFDFSIAEFIDKSKNNPSLSQIGEIVGTPLYMSPEQTMAQDADERSDIYSMGCAMFFALSGEHPLLGVSIIDTMQMHLSQDPPWNKIPEEMRSVVSKAMSKKPAQRYASMNELTAALEGTSSESPPEKKSR
ncbi:MAG: serine/threonine protein kinase [Cyanobacteria bacterium]|nr:serine/threonine protein kinase [Cyanobacteriota bacterium]